MALRFPVKISCQFRIQRYVSGLNKTNIELDQTADIQTRTRCLFQDELSGVGDVALLAVAPDRTHHRKPSGSIIFTFTANSSSSFIALHRGALLQSDVVVLLGQLNLSILSSLLTTSVGKYALPVSFSSQLRRFLSGLCLR